MEQSPSWEAKMSYATQEIPPILWNPKIHHEPAICPYPEPNQSSLRPPTQPLEDPF